VLGTIIIATLLAIWPGSRVVFQGSLAAEPDGGHASVALTAIEGAFHPMEAVAASLAPETPEAAPEAPPPTLVVAAEPETLDDPPSQPPPEPQSVQESIAVAAAPTGEMPAQDTSGQAQPPPPPEPTPVALPSEGQPEPASTTAAAEAAPLRVTAIGDSVMLAAANDLALAISGIEIDAEVGRPVSVAIDILRARRSAGQLGDVVVVHIGNNSPFSPSQFDEMMELLADVSRVVFVNLKVPRGWEGPNNAVLAEGVARYPNAALVDWYAASADHPQFLLDGVHLGPEGAQAYVQLVAPYVGVP
jgi:hypothetical protein